MVSAAYFCCYIIHTITKEKERNKEEREGICFIATKRVRRRFQHHETRMKPTLLRRSVVSLEPLGFMWKEMDERKDRQIGMRKKIVK